MRPELATLTSEQSFMLYKTRDISPFASPTPKRVRLRNQEQGPENSEHIYMLEMQALLPANLETQTTRVLHSLTMGNLEAGKVLNKKERFDVSCDTTL